MQIVRDLQSNMHGMRLAFLSGRGHANHSSARALRNARDQPIFTGQRERGFRFPESHHRASLRARDKSVAVNGDLPTGNGRRGRDSLNVWDAVSFLPWSQSLISYHSEV